MVSEAPELIKIMKKYNLPDNICTIQDLVNWLEKEVGLDTEIALVDFGNDLGICNKPITYDNYNISFFI